MVVGTRVLPVRDRAVEKFASILTSGIWVCKVSRFDVVLPFQDPWPPESSGQGACTKCRIGVVIFITMRRFLSRIRFRRC